jgi:hypothetical protein
VLHLQGEPPGSASACSMLHYTFYQPDATSGGHHAPWTSRLLVLLCVWLAGVPAHSFFKADASALSLTEPSLVRVVLMPTSFCFKRGQRVRVSVGGADAAHFTIEGCVPPPYSLKVHMGGDCASGLLLPTGDKDVAGYNPFVHMQYAQ